MSAAACILPHYSFAPRAPRAFNPRPAILPRVWAVAHSQPTPEPEPNSPDYEDTPPPSPNLAFYRKYTSALLRRYVRMSLEAGRTPSLLGQQEMFRARVTHYRVESFEDVVIFLHDVERCLERLNAHYQLLIARISLQQYTAAEVATSLGADPRTIIASHRRALDALTETFLSRKILEPQKCCQ